MKRQRHAGYNAYLNEYMKNRWTQRRRAAIAKLGGSCVQCGTTENLQFHHIDPSTKETSIGKASSWSETRFQAELIKCELLCDECHRNHHCPTVR
jgi:5-methylcytosine-specific restriction endonuclease McrA